MFKLLMSVAFFMAAICAHAADGATQTVSDAMKKIAPQAKIQSIVSSSLPGFQAVVADGHVLFVSDDGKYVIDGRVFDISSRRDLANEAMAGIRQEGLAKLGNDKKLIFAPPNPKYTVTVFTDVDCPYCREFHKQIAEYNRRGIAVEYVLFPLSIHPGADKKAQTVWCEKDRNAAYTNAMTGQTLPAKTCSNPIAEVTGIASSMGVEGTPAIFAKDGTQLGGYVPPDQLAQRLDELANGKHPPLAQ